MGKDDPETMPLHIRVPKKMYNSLLKRLADLRKTQPMANLSDAVRDALEKGLR